MWFVLGILALPLVEIALFVVIGGEIGLWPTLAWVVLSAVIGIAVIRTQGARTVAGLRFAAQDLRDPGALLANGAATTLAGILLVLPGFLTDAMGLILLIPQVRSLMLRRLGGRIKTSGFAARGFGAGSRENRGPVVIDGEFHEIEPGSLPPRGPSGWTRNQP